MKLLLKGKTLSLNFKPTLFLWGTILGLFLLFGYSNSSAQKIEDKKISVSFDNISIKEALRKIEAAGALVISYVDDEMPQGQVKGNYENKAIGFILTSILEKHNLTYQLAGYNVFIKKKIKPREIKKGILTGQVLDTRSREPIIGVMVMSGYAGTQTDIDGHFKMELVPGKYEVSFTYMGYKPVIQKDLVIKADQETHLDVTMGEDPNSLNEVVISERKITGTNVALISSIREARAIVSGISREQIARSQDRDAAEVVRRIPGVSVMQNRFIVVRGLPQRYNTVMLNNAIAPSFEADSRAFSFDILPSSMIDRIMVYKTAVPELPGDFAGGVVKIYSSGMPATNSLDITYLASVRPNTTFRSFYEQPQGKYAWLGYDDGTYKMPEGAPDLIEKKGNKEAISLFNNNWDVKDKQASVDHRLNLDFSKRLDISPGLKLGLIGGLSYSNTKQNNIVSRATGLNNNNGAGYELAYQFSDQVYAQSIRLNGLFNIAVDIGDKHHIDFKNLYTHTGEYEYTERNGLSGPLADDGTGLSSDQFIRQMIMTNSFRDIFSSQLNGSHSLFKHTKLDWLLAFTKSRYNDPDQRRRTQLATITSESGELDWQEKYSNTGMSMIRWGRLYFQLPEETKTLALNIEQEIPVSNSFSFNIKAGVYIEDKNRSFSLYGLGLMVLPDSEIVMGQHSPSSNFYTASNNLKAGYAALTIPFLKRFKFYGGLRIEDNRQQLHSEHWATNGPDMGAVNLDNHKISYLPSANLSYNVTDKSLLRAAFSQTLNRPEFREIAPFFYYDLRTFSTGFGNVHLKPQTDIYNYDLRYEVYPSPGEMFNVGVFYKKFINPLEYFYYNSTSGRNSYMWGNADKAINYGAEVDMIIALSRLTTKANFVGRNLERMTLLFNAAYIFSEVDMGSRTQVYQDKNRSLFGQSPYTINAALNYSIDSIGLKFNIAYNIIGKRIIMVGNDQNPNIYELPRHSLDFTFSKRVGRNFEIKGGIQNILNSRYLQMQDSDGNGNFDIGTNDYTTWKDNKYLSWYNGTYYTLGIGLKI